MHFRALAIFILVITFSCQKQKTPKFSQEIIDLKLASYNMSFFTNERLPNYQKDTLENRLKQIIRLKSAVMADSKPVINLSIKIDWKYKQSEIIVEPNAYIKHPDEFELLWRDYEGIRGLIFFEQGDRKKHLEFAAQVLDQLERGCEFYLKQDSEYIPILADTTSRKAFHITMLDYYGLLKSL
tara:strand:- start:28190 stop:28738 length:549 start_codon:yes stop_codon:yes gene_type:complete